MLRAVGRPRRSIRTRILAIAWVPSFALLMAGVVAAGYLAWGAAAEKQFATSSGSAADPVTPFVIADQRERELTIRYLTDPNRNRSALDAQRKKTDATLGAITSTSSDVGGEAPEGFKPVIARMGRALGSLPELRKRVDAGGMTVAEAAQGYTDTLGAFQLAFAYLAENSASADDALQFLLTGDLFRVAELRSQSEALAVGAFSQTGLTVQEFDKFVDLVGSYHALMAATIPRVVPEEQNALKAVMASTAWQQLRLIEDTALQTAAAPRGTSSTHRAGAMPLSRTTWDAASADVSQKLIDIYTHHSDHATELAVDHAQQGLMRALLIGLGFLLLALLVFAIVTRMSARLIGRLNRLQTETLELANVSLPAMVERIRGGEQVDIDKELPPLDHGVDEIGEVANAFNQAQRAAFVAAANEAETRAGTGKVFLNIAHRNQLIAHHQLKVLDQAERTQEDPDQLNLLFQLDHLATRARRNAENLIILGGGQAGRRWRNPVPLLQVVRSAIGEAETYTRVSTGQIPQVAVTGAAVADIVHLLAELVDNATSFSPPSARVEVRGNVVGRGIVIEIEDQGLGIEPDQLQELNKMLQSSPDFGIMALSDEPRLGLFVVTQLASRHGVRVTLTDSPSYGGTRAVVLIPSALIAAAPAEHPELEYDRGPVGADPHEIMQTATEVVGSRMRSRRANRAITLAPAEPLVPQQAQGVSPNSPPSAPRGVPQVYRPGFAQNLPTNLAGDLGEKARTTAEIPVVRPATATNINTSAARMLAQNLAQTAAQGSGPSRDQRPALPRRTRQAHLAPQLQDETPAVAEPQPAQAAAYQPSAEHARDRLAAFQRGTKLGRDK